MSANWKTAFRSFYYETMEAPPPVVLDHDETALLVIDIQACYLPNQKPEGESAEEWLRWAPFRTRLSETVIPNSQRLVDEFRARQMDVFWARIACLNDKGRDRSLSQSRPGFNNLLLPKDAPESQIVQQIVPMENEIIVLKTTDSALTGTNLRLILHNMGTKNIVVCGIFTDQCVSSTVRSLADESFNVVVVHDACAAATMELHESELCIINNIYCQVLSCEETREAIATGHLD